MVELPLHAPWFLLSVEVVDPDVAGHSMMRTLCIAWEHDLAEILRSLDTARVKGIVCMMPAWQSPTGQWSSRDICEVWHFRSASGQHVTLRDLAGNSFDCGLIPEHVEPVKLELLLRVFPRQVAEQSQKQAKARRSHRVGGDVKADA